MPLLDAYKTETGNWGRVGESVWALMEINPSAPPALTLKACAPTNTETETEKAQPNLESIQLHPGHFRASMLFNETSFIRAQHFGHIQAASIKVKPSARSLLVPATANLEKQ